MAFASSTDVPPNFITIMLHLDIAQNAKPTGHLLAVGSDAT